MNEEDRKELIHDLIFLFYVIWSVASLAVSIYCGRPIASTKIVYLIGNMMIDFFGWDE